MPKGVTMDTEKSRALQKLIHEFLQMRLQEKIEKIKDDDPERAEEKRLRECERFQAHNWLDDAARRAAQIQAVTHTLKAVHSGAKGGSSLHAHPASLKKLPIVGSHCLGNEYTLDVTGNAGVLDVFDFLSREYDGQTLLELAVNNDVALATALSDDAEQTKRWMQSFAALLEIEDQPSAHTLAKQLYWPISSDVENDSAFHLLEPLFPSSLVHKAYELIHGDLDAAKHYRISKSPKFKNQQIELSEKARAWEAQEKGVMHELAVSKYPLLAVKNIGGQTIQSKGNVSRLNQVRQGANYLLASVPPQWVSQPLKPLLNIESMFGRYGRRAEVKTELRAMLKFLKTDPPATLSTRNRRAQHVNALLLEFLQFTSELRELESGWVAQPECKLKAQHAFWLDPEGAAQHAHAQNQTPPTDVLNVVSEDFALWFNHQLQSTPAGSLPVGDPEYNVWRKLCEEALKAYERGGLEEAMRWLDLEADERDDTTTQNAKQEVAHV